MIERTPCRFEEQEIRITSSFGVACHGPDAKLTPADLYKAADERLYQQKTAAATASCDARPVSCTRACPRLPESRRSECSIDVRVHLHGALDLRAVCKRHGVIDDERVPKALSLVGIGDERHVRRGVRPIRSLYKK